MSRKTIKGIVCDTKFYGKLTVLSLCPDRKDNVIVKCECGVIKSTNLYGLNRGKTFSCGSCREVGGLELNQCFTNHKFGNYVIKEINSSSEVVVLFDTGNSKTVSANQARSGAIRNPLHKTVMGIGYLGIGKYKSRYGNTTTKTPQYRTWENMMSRCYYPKASRYEAYGGRGVKVHPDWYNYQVFAEWFDSNWKEGYDLDKDILGDGLLYSSEVCRYIPQDLNKILNTSLSNTGKRKEDLPEGIREWGTGGNFVATYRGDKQVFPNVKSASNWYHKMKTSYIRDLALKYYKEGKLSKDIYEVLKDYDSVEGLKEY